MATDPGSFSNLGTRLRHLIDLLDSTLEEVYARDCDGYRPRFTPILRALLEKEPSSIRDIANFAGITHSAASQTVALMIRQGFLERVPGKDGRERLIAMSPRTRGLLPRIERQWRATTAATYRLDSELTAPLSRTVDEAIEALERRPFAQRLEEEAAKDPG